MNGTNYEVRHCEFFSTSNSYPFWVHIFASGSCFQIPLACVPPLTCKNIIYRLPYKQIAENFADDINSQLAAVESNLINMYDFDIGAG